MPLFIKKEEEETEQFINELKSLETQPPEQKDQKDQKIQILQTKKTDQLPKGTLIISILNDNFEFARFTIKPEIFNESIEMLKNLLSSLAEPQLKINSNCDCVWCQQKIKELQECLGS